MRVGVQVLSTLSVSTLRLEIESACCRHGGHRSVSQQIKGPTDPALARLLSAGDVFVQGPLPPDPEPLRLPLLKL